MPRAANATLSPSGDGAAWNSVIIWSATTSIGVPPSALTRYTSASCTALFMWK
ncbi:MAG: hypothetical protein QM757_43850 [Paludibaculum sp.]